MDAPNSLNASVNGPSAAVTASLLWNFPTLALSRTDNDYSKDVKEITGGGADIALEDVGIATFSKSLRSLRTGGRMVVIGNLKPESVELPLGLIILKGNTIKGSISSTRDDLKMGLDMLKSKIHPEIGAKIKLESINEGYKDMLDRKVLGRVLIEYK